MKKVILALIAWMLLHEILGIVGWLTLSGVLKDDLLAKGINFSNWGNLILILIASVCHQKERNKD